MAIGPTGTDMLRIPCPLCGERPYMEYRYGGDADKARPAHGSGESKEWHDYVFLFDNPKGPHQEYWQHVHGCRQWLVVVRDTATNLVSAVRLAREAREGQMKSPRGE